MTRRRIRRRVAEPDVDLGREDQLVHPGEGREEQQVEREDDEGSTAAHPPAKLLDTDRVDAPERATGGQERVHVHESTRRGRLGAGHLEEQLLEVARRSGEADDLDAGTDRVGQQSSGRRVVATEPQLDRAVLEDRRGGDLGVGREPVARRAHGRVVAEHPDAQDRAEPEPLFDVRHPALGEDLSAVHDRHARAQLLELGKDVAADEDRLAQGSELSEQLAQFHACPRVEARRGLIEQQDLRVVDEGVRETETLLHAAGQRLHVLVALVGEIDELEEVADHPTATGRGDAVAAREEVEVLPHLHVVVDPEHIRHEAEDATDVVGVPGHRVPADLGLTARWPQQGREDAQRGRLASPVRADEPEDLPGLDGEVDAGHGDRAVVALDETVGPDDGGHRTFPVMDRSKAKPTPSWRSLTKRTSTAPDAGSM